MDDAKTFLPIGDQITDQFRGMLQVSIHGNYSFAAGMIESGFKGVLMPEVPGKGNISDAGMFGSKRFDLVQGMIRTSVVNKNNLKGMCIDFLHLAGNPFEQFIDIAFFIEAGNDD